LGDAGAIALARPMSLAWNCPIITRASASMVETDTLEMDEQRERRAAVLLPTKASAARAPIGCSRTRPLLRASAVTEADPEHRQRHRAAGTAG
jgi:hypothetical protein